MKYLQYKALKSLAEIKQRPISLQFFAEGGEEGSDSGDGADPEGDGGKGDGGKGSEKKYSDADVDELISKKFAKWQAEQEKKISEAKKLAEMNAQERAEHERDELQKKIDEYERRQAVADMMATSRKALADVDIKNIPDELLSALIGSDAESTKAAVDSFAALFKKAVQDGIAEALKGKTPPKGGTAKLTKEQILAVADKRERQRLIAENINLFREAK